MSIPDSQHQQYPVIAALSIKLSVVLKNATLHEAYTLSKDELVLVFSTEVSNWFTVKIVQRYQSCFLFFEKHKPEKVSNAQSCFEAILGKKIEAVVLHIGNRSFTLKFDEHTQLVFKLYDSLVNVLLFKEDTVEDLFRKNIINDWDLTLADFVSKQNEPQVVASVFYIYQRAHIHPFYVATSVQPDTLLLQSPDVLGILSEFSRHCLSHYYFTTSKQQLLNSYSTEVKKLEGNIYKSENALLQLQAAVSSEEIGHIIMANMQHIKPQMIQAELFDFYRNKQLVVKLKKELNAQQNAAYYFRKHKKSKIEYDQLLQKNEQNKLRLQNVTALLLKLQLIESIKELKPFLPKAASPKQIVYPFKQFECEGYQIWVGKNAANNDILTLKHAHKNDLWLHAKDVSGSHVVVKWKPGKEFPKKVLMRAAELAAYYSKLKGSTLVPVSFTLKKFVRKPKGAEPGQVVVDKEEVLMVEPKLD